MEQWRSLTEEELKSGGMLLVVFVRPEGGENGKKLFVTTAEPCMFRNNIYGYLQSYGPWRF